MRVDSIARNQLGLTVPVPGQVAPVEESSSTVLAEAPRGVAAVTNRNPFENPHEWGGPLRRGFFLSGATATPPKHSR